MRYNHDLFNNSIIEREDCTQCGRITRLQYRKGVNRSTYLGLLIATNLITASMVYCIALIASS